MAPLLHTHAPVGPPRYGTYVCPQRVSVEMCVTDRALLQHNLGSYLSAQTMDPAASQAFRHALASEGGFEELLRVLVALGENPKVSEADAMGFIMENFGNCTQPPLVKARPGECVEAKASYDLLQENIQLKERIAALKSSIKAVKEEMKARIPEGTLTVFGLAAYDIPDVDIKGGQSDPFVRVSLLDVPNLDGPEDEDEDFGRTMDPIAFAEYCTKHRIAAQTGTVQNSVNPVWQDEVLEIVLPAGTPRPPRVLVRLWDDDVSKSDDPIASAEVQLEPNEGSFEKLALKGRGDLPDVLISFEYKMIEP